MSTWSTDSDCYDASALAYTALTAYSAARVDQGRSAVTDLETQRTEAQRQIYARLRQRGILPGEIDRTADLKAPETYLALALLFEAVMQFSPDGTGDVYAQAAARARERYEHEMAVAAPTSGVRSAGMSFELGRG